MDYESFLEFYRPYQEKYFAGVPYYELGQTYGLTTSGTNFGLYELISVGNTGHHYIVHVPVPSLPITEWPLADYNEENGIAYIFSGSITKWFPAYMLYIVNDLYKVYFSLKSNGEEIPNWRLEEIENLNEQKDEIIEFSKRFDVQGFEEIFEEILKRINNLEPLDIDNWYSQIEKNTYVGTYYELKNKNASRQEWTDFIVKHPFYSKPLVEQFEKYPEDAILAAEVFKRNPRYFETRSAYKHTHRAAKVLAKEKGLDGVEQFLNELSDIVNTGEIGEIYLKKKDYLSAIAAFENTIINSYSDTEELHDGAYQKILQITDDLPESDYKAFIQAYVKSLV